MGLFSFFGDGEHRVFDYKPIYYDKEAEERRQKFGRVDGTLDKEKERLIEISADGQITEDEYADFNKIKSELTKISSAVNSLQLWIDKTIADGKIDADRLNNA